jgi:hypothetical protein
VVACFGWVEVGVCRLVVFAAVFVLTCLGLGEFGLCSHVSCSAAVGVVAGLDFFAVVDLAACLLWWFGYKNPKGPVTKIRMGRLQ